MQIYNINPNLICFYFGGDTEPNNPNLHIAVEDNWVIGACDGLGVASYAIHNEGAAIIYDTLCSPEQAQQVKIYLEKELAINKFTAVLSHWHLDHIGGNELYKASNIVATRKTRMYMQQHKPDIELGKLWGLPAIEKVRLPDVVFDHDISLFLGELEVQLFNFDVHTDDSLCAYIPKYKLLLAGDMLEDTAPFITNPEAIPHHLKNYNALRQLNIERIFPNHGRSQIIKNGGYPKELIESVTYYLGTLYNLLEKDPQAQVPELKNFMNKYLDKNLIVYWHPYELVHENNIKRVRSFFKGTWAGEGKLKTSAD